MREPIQVDLGDLGHLGTRKPTLPLLVLLPKFARVAINRGDLLPNLPTYFFQRNVGCVEGDPILADEVAEHLERRTGEIVGVSPVRLGVKKDVPGGEARAISIPLV